jgi:c-di-GMP-binding flagellar brake protein YcgR
VQRTSDRRRAVRFPIEIPIQLTLRGRSYRARTRDVSVEGVAVVLDRAVPIGVGDRVDFLFALEHVDASGVIHLQGTALVVRAYAGSSERILAIKADWLLTTTQEAAVASLDSRPS